MPSATETKDIKTLQEQAHRVIYVIIGHGVINDRVAKVTKLNIKDSTIVLVAPVATGVAHEEVVVKPYPNPTGLFRFLSLPKFKRTIDHYLFFPSNKILYVKAVQRVLQKRIHADIKHGKQVVVLTCVPSHDLCLLGLALKQTFPQIYWMVDWQDLWSYDENYFERTPRPYRPSLLRLERRIHRMCDLNVTTNSYAKHVLEDVYGVPSGRVVAIPHHFSNDDLAVSGNDTTNLAQSGKQGVVKIGFLGTLFKPPRVPGTIVQQALREINASGVRVELHIHGNFPKHATTESLARMREDGLWFHGRSNHQDSVRKLMQYDFLLLLLADLPNSRAVMSIKLPHYLSLGIPIIAVVPEPSAVANIVMETGAGYVVPINSNWQAQLGTILRSARANTSALCRSESAIQNYSWSNLSKHWIDILKFGRSTP